MCIAGPSTVSQGAGTGQDCRQALGQPLPNYARAESLQNHRTLLQSSSKSLIHFLSIFGLNQVLFGINLIDIIKNYTIHVCYSGIVSNSDHFITVTIRLSNSQLQKFRYHPNMEPSEYQVL